MHGSELPALLTLGNLTNPTPHTLLLGGLGILFGLTASRGAGAQGEDAEEFQEVEEQWDAEAWAGTQELTELRTWQGIPGGRHHQHGTQTTSVYGEGTLFVFHVDATH